MDSTTRNLVGFWRSADTACLSPAAADACKRRLIDTLGCALLAFDAPVSRMARNVAAMYPRNPGATVWGTTKIVAPEAAAFANGVMLRLADMSDMYREKSGGHPSDVIAAVLAAGEMSGASGRDILNAIVLAYDVYCSFCAAIDINSRGWDQPVYSILGAVLGAGKLMQLTDEQMAHAIALALAPNMALYQTRHGELSNWKGCAAANASRNAVFAAVLAREGFTGPTAVFEGKGGLFDAVGRFEWTLPALDGTRYIERTHFKCFPICYHGQTAVWAALEARPQIGTRAIAKIELETYKSAVEIMAGDSSRWAPTTHETADHSLPYVIATALTDGEVTMESFAHERLAAPAIVALMQKVAVRESAECTALHPGASACRLVVTLDDGAQIETAVRYPKGHNQNTLDDAEIGTKFKQMLRGFASPESSAALLAKLHRFDEVTNVRALLGEIAAHALEERNSGY